MRYALFIRSMVTISCLLLCCFITNAAEMRISLKRAMALKIITVNAAYNRFSPGETMKLELVNNGDKDLKIDVDPGLIFQPDDTSFQDMVLLGGDVIALEAKKKDTVKLQAFCGKSYAMGPFTGHHYHFWKQGDSNMIKTLSYGRTNNIDLQLIQKAVWTFTNHHCLNSIYASNAVRMSEDFARYVANLRKTRLPQFYIDYKIDNTAGHRVVMGSETKFYVTMHWSADDGYRHMHLAIYRENGTVYKTIEADQIIDKLGYTVNVQFDPKRDPEGIYTVALYDDANRVWDKKKIVVGLRDCDMVF